MIPKEFEADLMAMGYETEPKPNRKIIEPDPRFVEIISEQIAIRMLIPAAMTISFAGLLLCFAIN